MKIASGILVLALGGLVLTDCLAILNSDFDFMADSLARMENLLL